MKETIFYVFLDFPVIFDTHNDKNEWIFNTWSMFSNTCPIPVCDKSFEKTPLSSLLSGWLVTMCDIWSVVCVTCGAGSYLPSCAFVSNSSFNKVPVAQTVGPLLTFCFFVFLTFVLRCVGSGYTNVVFQLSLYLLGLK